MIKGKEQGFPDAGALHRQVQERALELVAVVHREPRFGRPRAGANNNGKSAGDGARPKLSASGGPVHAADPLTRLLFVFVHLTYGAFCGPRTGQDPTQVRTRRGGASAHAHVAPLRLCGLATRLPASAGSTAGRFRTDGTAPCASVWACRPARAKTASSGSRRGPTTVDGHRAHPGRVRTDSKLKATRARAGLVT